MKQRVIGFDLARAYAIFGMYIVNFNIVFGNYYDATPVGKFLSLFSGNSSTIFVLLAGMGVSLMSNRPEYQMAEQKKIKRIISKRSWFLFATGLLLYTWWPADILHFYGAYMHMALLLLFVPPKWYLLTGAAAVIVFHLLLLLIPYETGWNFETLQYHDFWTIKGFIRNTFYNGWNPVFPWLAYFMLGMYLGRLNWQEQLTQKNIFMSGAVLFSCILLLQIISNHITLSQNLHLYIHADYLPPFLPFMLSTTGSGMMMIAAFMFICSKCENNSFVQSLAQTGKMTLTHYISHLTIGLLVFASLSGKIFTGTVNKEPPVPPLYILLFSVIYFAVSCCFSIYWLRKYKHGPLELLMRKIAG